MGLADDLLEDAMDLAGKGDTENRESCLRRAISTAYYAVFHLFVADLTEQSKFAVDRGRLGRMFAHRAMREAEVRPKDAGKPTEVEKGLEQIKKDFRQLQENRERADYDLAWKPEYLDAIESVALADGILKDWRAIRTEDAARHYLLSMFGAKR